jgi:hypothetical protein
MSRRSIPVVWRDAIGDSDLDSTAKLVAYQLTRWMNGRGVCFPSREEIAAKASLSVRAVELAISRLEADGWLQIERSRGRRSHRYCAALPPTANEIRRSEWPTANERPSNGERRSSNGERRSPEDVVRRRSVRPLPPTRFRARRRGRRAMRGEGSLRASASAAAGCAPSSMLTRTSAPTASSRSRTARAVAAPSTARSVLRATAPTASRRSMRSAVRGHSISDRSAIDPRPSGACRIRVCDRRRADGRRDPLPRRDGRLRVARPLRVDGRALGRVRSSSSSARATVRVAQPAGSASALAARLLSGLQALSPDTHACGAAACLRALR